MFYTKFISIMLSLSMECIQPEPHSAYINDSYILRPSSLYASFKLIQVQTIALFLLTVDATAFPQEKKYFLPQKW